MLLQPRLDTLAEQRAVRQHHGGPPTRLQQADDESKKKIRRLARSKLGWEVVLDTWLLLPAERRIREDDVHPVRGPIISVRPGESVVVSNETGGLDPVQKHIRYAQHVR